MRSQIITRLLVIVLVISLMPVRAIAEVYEPIKKNISVQPILDNDSDEKSVALARTISDALILATSHSIVDFEKARSVLKYNEGSKNGDPLEQAAKEIAKAKEDYFAFNYKGAIDGLKAAIAELEGYGDLSSTGALLAEAHLSLALIARTKNDEKLSAQSIANVLWIDPLIEISEKDFPPSFKSFFDDTKKNYLASANTGSITVATSPPVAEIYLNGNFKGVSPISFTNLPEGSYKISIKAAKYAVVVRSVDVHAGKETKVKERISWSDSNSQKNTPIDDPAANIRDALAMANIVKADKMIVVNSSQKSGTLIRMVDAKLGASHRPFLISTSVGDEDELAAVAKAAEFLSVQSDEEILKDPVKRIDPIGIGDPVILGKRRNRSFLASPVFLGAVGLGIAGAIAGGVFAATSGSGDDYGAVKVRFK